MVKAGGKWSDFLGFSINLIGVFSDHHVLLEGIIERHQWQQQWQTTNYYVDLFCHMAMS